MVDNKNEAKASIQRAEKLPAIGAQAMDHRTTTSNVRVADIKPMITPALLIEQFPITNEIKEFVVNTRCEISDIIHGRDDRVLCIVGPCSVHDIVAAEKYGILLKQLIDEFKEDLVVVMRVYFEKPRTTIGWKGLINDPELNGSYNINKGMKEGRKLLLRLLEKNIGVGCEWLDTISPQYIADLVCWGAIGARTTESQVHRQLVSALSMPVGFKNATSGNFEIASNSILSAKYEHVFTSVTQQGVVAIVRSTGNDDCHCIHRGGKSGPNYEQKYIEQSVAQLKEKGVCSRIMVDCSHANSGKDYRKQPNVCSAVAEQINVGSENIMGVMIESNIKEGKQKLDLNALGGLENLEYGKSITDSCVNLVTTRKMLTELSAAVRQRRKLKKSCKRLRK